MFDFSWSELAVIAIVALVLIGPKDMPVAIRAISGAIKKMRRMAGEFQHHVDDMLRDADMQELRDVQSTLRNMRGMNLRNTIERAIDPEGSLPRRLDDPFRAHPVPPTTAPAFPEFPEPPTGPAPDFIPPAASGPAEPPEHGG